MPCSASTGAAETANGAVERMVLLGLTGVYYTISAAMRLWSGRNPSPAQSAAKSSHIPPSIYSKTYTEGSDPFVPRANIIRVIISWPHCYASQQSFF